MGAKYLARNVEALAVNGRLVIIGLQGGTKAELDLGTLLRKRAAVIATSLRARPADEKATIVAAVREHVWPLDRGRAGRARSSTRATRSSSRRGPPRAGGERATSARSCSPPAERSRKGCRPGGGSRVARRMTRAGTSGCFTWHHPCGCFTWRAGRFVAHQLKHPDLSQTRP